MPATPPEELVVSEQALRRAPHALSRRIRADAKNTRALPSGARYTVGYYQREYRWQSKPVVDLYGPGKVICLMSR
jgi:hypothetical protein